MPIDQASENLKIVSRPPVVVILGHVDHGKTSLLDYIRINKAAPISGSEPRPVAGREAGGITQHIGAYQVEVGDNPPSPKTSGGQRKITFLDTPGHEAFTAIRSRGVKVADVAVLVVAADEGIKPQTKEAIQIIKQAELPFVVALNKIDKEGINPAKVKQELAENEVMVEGYGGQVPIAELSARTGEGIDHLLDLILLLAELEELSAPMETPAKGVVIESHLDKRRGLVATLIIQGGELKIGDWVSAGIAVGKVKSLEDFLGKNIKLAIASQPCLATGWESAPKVGQEFQVVLNREEAEKQSALVAELAPVVLFGAESSGTDIAINKKFANLIIKTDVQSSLEAIDQVLRTIKSEEVNYKVINYGVGNITDNDIKNASASNAGVVGFHVGIEDSAKNSAEREKVKVVTFDIIYELVEGVRQIMSDLLEPEIKRIPLGKLKILALFKGADTKSQIVGGKITQGKAIRGAIVDVIRNNTVLMTGKLGQLQQKKADVPEVTEGFECGVRFDTSAKTPFSIAVGDVLEIYQEEKNKRTV